MKLPNVKIQFRLRSLLQCVALLGVGLAIFAHEKRLADEQADIVEHLDQLGFGVTYRAHGESIFGTREDPGIWRRWLGDDMFDSVDAVEGRIVNFMWSAVDDDRLIESVPYLRKLPSGFTLSIFGSGISDAGVRSLTHIPHLDAIALSNFHNSVSGALDFLRTLPALKEIDVSDSSISDSAIDILASLQQLEVLDVRETALSADGIDRLRHMMPNCVIRGDDTPDYILKRDILY